jgi:hypothetical protein
MDIFSIDLTIQEINLLRQSLDVITITGKDAKFVGGLQYKLETELQAIQNLIAERQAEEQAQKAAELQKAIAAEAKKKKLEASKQESQA